ncbi:MAG TPA: hypothetical protein VF868_03285 [Bacteroidia bacterium]|jgi:hypothetical protein
MKKLFLLIISLCLFLVNNTIAQKLNPSEQKRVNEAFKKGKMVHFKFTISSTQEILPLTKFITVEKSQGKMVFARADKEGFSKFILKGYPYTIIKNSNPVAKKTKAKK